MTIKLKDFENKLLRTQKQLNNIQIPLLKGIL